LKGRTGAAPTPGGRQLESSLRTVAGYRATVLIVVNTRRTTR
jgi:hypothetical protein